MRSLLLFLLSEPVGLLSKVKSNVWITGKATQFDESQELAARLNSARQSMPRDKVWKQMVSSVKPIALVKSHHQCHSLRIQVV